MGKEDYGPAFHVYSRQLIELHDLIRCGDGDAAVADQLRDEIDTTWRQLTADEIERVRQMSAELSKR